MSNLSDINNWKSNFGLLPIKINPINGIDRYLMLNGGSGDFCFQPKNNNENEGFFFGNSWSTNTKNYVVLENDAVKLYNWIKKTTEEIKISDIGNNTDKFYKYLVSKSYKTENDAVPFIINIFRQLRNITQEKENPSITINLLYQLLISINEDISSINYEEWNIDKIDLPNQFDYYVNLLKDGVNKIPKDLDLILRHSSGALFQEAHREVVYFNPQIELFGGVSNEMGIKKDSYSSIHYTPQYLARSIVENSLKNLDISKPTLKIFDPACGSSEFLIETLKQLKNLGFTGKIFISGWDTSESAIKTSKFLLQYENRTQWNRELTIDIRKVEDSLIETWDNDYDLIVMNPPFISWELLKDKNSKEALLNSFGDNLKMVKPNQASAFFYKSILSLNSNGVIGCVIPSSIFTFDSYKNLRKNISEQLTLKLIGKLGNYVFEDALTDVSIFIGKKIMTNSIPKLIWSKNEKGIIQNVISELRKMDSKNELVVNEKDFSIYTPSSFNISNWKINSLNEEKIKINIERFVVDGFLYHLKDMFIPKSGIIKGLRNSFTISQDEYIEIPDSERIFLRKIANNKSIKNGKLFEFEYLWYPYDENEIIFKNEEEFKKKTPILFEKFYHKKSELSKRARKDENSWFHLSEHRAWLRKRKKRLLSIRFGNSNSFAFDKNGDYVVEEGIAWIPKKEFENDDYYFYLAIFSSSVFDILLSIYSKQLAGGKWYDLGAKYTSNIPIPNVHIKEVKEHSAYSKLVSLGKELSNGNSFVKEIINDVLKDSFYKMIE